MGNFVSSSIALNPISVANFGKLLEEEFLWSHQPYEITSARLL